MLASRNGKFYVPRQDDLIPLPAESEIFMLPDRLATGLDLRTGKREIVKNNAVAAFASPGYTLNAHPAYYEKKGAPHLPLFAYGAVGYLNGRFWICARKVDSDPRQIFSSISDGQIRAACKLLLRSWPENRLVNHIINNCVRKYGCPAARNFALGRYEAPLPSSQSCNAHCVGCISSLQKDSPASVTPQCRIGFTPSAEELCEVMLVHESRETRHPVYSFGQGCEGDPLLNADLLADSIKLFRKENRTGRGHGTLNCNTNGSVPDAMELLASSGLTSVRISMNSAQPELYEAYYRPSGYTFTDVVKSARLARKCGLYVSLNLLYFPGLTDTENELSSLTGFCTQNGVSMIQWRNLNIDPHWYETYMSSLSSTNGKKIPSMGLTTFMDKLRKACPWLNFGYFNPWLGDRATLLAPDIS